MNGKALKKWKLFFCSFLSYIYYILLVIVVNLTWKQNSFSSENNNCKYNINRESYKIVKPLKMVSFFSHSSTPTVLYFFNTSSLDLYLRTCMHAFITLNRKSHINITSAQCIYSSIARGFLLHKYDYVIIPPVWITFYFRVEKHPNIKKGVIYISVYVWTDTNGISSSLYRRHSGIETCILISCLFVPSSKRVGKIIKEFFFKIKYFFIQNYKVKCN